MKKQITNMSNVYLSLPNKQLKPGQTIVLEGTELNEYMLDRIQSLVRINCLKVFDIKEEQSIIENTIKEEEQSQQELIEESIVEEKPKRKRTTKKQVTEVEEVQEVKEEN